MKIAIDARCLTESFTSNRSYWRGLVSGFEAIADREGLEITLVINGKSSTDLAFDTDRMKVHATEKRSERWWSLIDFPRACHQLGVQVAHMQYSVSPFFRTATATTIHDVSYFVNPEWFSPRDSFLLRTTVPRAARKADRVIAVSEHAKSEIVKYLRVSDRKVLVTTQAPQLGIRPLDQAHADAVLASLGVSSPFLLLVGGLTERKNWRLALEVLARVKKVHSSMNLVITGPDKAGAGEVEHAIGSLGLQGAVLTVGGVSIEALNALYSRTSALVHTSLYEGFGLTPLEAFRCGAPVIAAHTSSLPEVVRGFGRLVSGFDPDVWAREVIAAIETGDAGREERMRYSESFSWVQTAEQTLEAYRQADRASRG